MRRALGIVVAFAAVLAGVLVYVPDAQATRETPSIRLSSQSTSSGAKSTSVSIPSGTTNAIISFQFGGVNSNAAPTSVTLDGQSATKKVSGETAGQMMIAVYTVSGLSTGAGKTFAYTNGSGYTVLDIGIEFRDGTPSYGATDTDNCNGCGSLTTNSLANSNGNEFLCAYSANGGTLSGVGSGQSTLDDTSGGSDYGFTTKTTTGTSTMSSFTISGLAAYGCIIIGLASPPTFSVAPAIGTRTTSSIPVTATTACSDCSSSPAGYYGVAVTSGSGAPSCTQIIAGQNSSGSAAYKSFGPIAMTATVQATGTFSSYTDGTVRDGYFCLKSTGSGNSAVSSIASMYKIPAFTTGLTVASTSNTVYTSNSKVLDGAGSVFWVACNAGSAAPSVSQVEALTGGCIKLTSSGTATGTQTLTSTDSPAFPVYDLYFVGTYGSQHEASVHTLTGQCLSAPSNFQYVNCPTGLASVTDTGSVPKAFNDALFRTLGYKSQTVNFTVGSIVVDSTSGAWGFILLDSDSGATGTLTILKASGSFANNDVLFDQSGAAALASGADSAYTTIATSDILEAPTTVSPSGAALTIDSSGQYSYTASGRQTALAGSVFHASTNAYLSLTVDFYANNATPSSSAPQLPFFTHGSAVDYNVGALYADADNDTLKFGHITSIPSWASFSPTTGHLTGTASVDATTAMTFIGFDPALTYGTQSVTSTVASSWPMIDCVSTPTQYNSCANQVNLLTSGQVLVNLQYVCNPASFDLVVAQSPDAGTTLFQGNSVTITASAASSCLTAPSCLLQTVTQCDATMNAAAPGATVTPSTGCVDSRVKIYSQGPAVGDTVPTNFNLTVFCR